MDILTTIAEYRYRLKAKGYAQSTIEGYSKNLDQFSRYLEVCGINDFKKVTHQVILTYQDKLMAQDNAMETKALKIRAVKRLFENLEQTHRLLVNPTEGIVETCRKNRKPGPVLTQAQVKRLLQQPDLSSKASIRDKTIMEVLYSTAIRLNELICLEVYHTDLRDKVLYIRKGKGGKQRVVPLGKNACQYLREYLDKVRPWYARKNLKGRRIFLLNTGQSMTPASIRSLLFKYRKQAKINQSASPHTMRRSCATHLLQNGADIRYIQKLLGHKRLSTTQLYTKVMPMEVKQTHEKTHPQLKIK
ncbi:MAG: tyrosine-type recombinase/integrase [Desulfobacula sp.]|nr:tyrosine-type recombinase/integrase [Desulfobacula sp.]MCF6247127.1 tyrosine-type recombinase/integrase [Desulfobacula sp.]